MREYRVTWVIDVTAGDAVTAAQEALEIMQDVNSTAKFFSVVEVDTGEEELIDLEIVQLGQASGLVGDPQ